LCDLGPQEELPEARKIRELRSSVKVKKRDDTSFQLPAKLLALRDIFVGIQTVYRMMKHRNKKTTYEELRQGVEEICKKRFEVRFYGFSWMLNAKWSIFVDMHGGYLSAGKIPLPAQDSCPRSFGA
jgi:hypothetical protein